jgi:hypothetical protein
MASTNTVTTLDGLYKKVYGAKGPIVALPETSIMQDLVPFQSAKREGKSYNVPIVVSDEHGFSYGDADETITLNTEIAATLKEITVNGAQIVGQASLNYAAAARSEGSEAAFMSAGHLVVQNLNTSASKKLEASLLYGRSGIATVSSLNSQDIICTAASWADGLMMSLINCKIDVYQSDNTTLRQGDLVVTAVNPTTYTITVTGTTSGIVSTDIVYFDGANGKECYGLNSIMTNTGTMFGISATTYPIWSASSYSASSAPLTMAKVLGAAAQAVSRGGLNGEAVLLCHPSSWNNLNSDQAALRSYTDSGSKATNGFGEIEYRGVNGKIKVVSHPMVKRGDAFLFNPKDLKRVGSQDISNTTPGRSDEIFMHSQTLSAYLIRVYSNQAIFCEKPAAMVKLTSIVPS